MVYRFRPNGVDGALFDLLFLRPKPIDGPCPPPPDAFELEIEDSYTKCPGTEFLGAVYMTKIQITFFHKQKVLKQV